MKACPVASANAQDDLLSKIKFLDFTSIVWEGNRTFQGMAGICTNTACMHLMSNFYRMFHRLSAIMRKLDDWTELLKKNKRWSFGRHRLSLLVLSSHRISRIINIQCMYFYLIKLSVVLSP